jgi:hypothetical protein
MSFLAFTQLTYVFMQNDTVEAKITTILYTTICFLALLYGYIAISTKDNASLVYSTAYSVVAGRVEPSQYEVVNDKRLNRLVLIFALCTIAVSINNVLPYYNNFSEIQALIRNPGKAYEYVKFINRNNLVDNNGGILGSIIGIILNILTFTRYFLFAFVILYWRKLSRKIKWFSLLAIAIFLLHAFLIGAMVNIGLVFFSMLPPLFLLLTGYRNSSVNQKSTSKKGRLLLLSISAVLLSLLIYFMGSRDVFALEDSTESSLFMSGILGLLYYISHGYVGLSGCLSLPFVCTFGQTTFHGLADTLQPYLGYTNLFSDSYLARNQAATGWSALHLWSTIFPWLASDFSFVLVPVIMFFMGLLLRKAWQASLDTRNPYAIVWCGQLLIFCFMIPANNQLFHTFGNSMSTLVILFLYLRSTRRHQSLKIAHNNSNDKAFKTAPRASVNNLRKCHP